MGSVKIENLVKKFEEVEALTDVNVEIKEGEFFALLGPSGCGKTTTMRCIAGFETPTAGTIKIGEGIVNNVPPNQRNCGMVFQSYALFPHYNVFENVAYSLNIKKLKESGLTGKLSTYARLLSRRLSKYPKDIEQKVWETLEYVELAHLSDRLTSELSGGQQQRVALARALIMEPAVLLMDEPLSNLDQKLRHSMRNTIRKIQQDLGITTIFVTHDQEEAMSMADRVAVMSDGKVKQIGTPTDLYSNPGTSFIADFVGSSNILKGKVVNREDPYCTVQFNGSQIRSTSIPKKDEVEVVIRPENITIIQEHEIDPEKNILEGTIMFSTYLGAVVRYDIQVGTYQIIVDTTYKSGDSILSPGHKVHLTIEPERVLLI
ncbi:ABC transporter ATP-binding protein [Alkalihalobacillus sp. TS-13]|uniref:ABC transporter ATP-binding protein n=1 Tax=Alkalihalobacillus sp. TS-13 TaxID=2842455 RepID=UPI001C881844|nr:ABC transporter ATP-binding protein [Alkalihalobacillus sp. TS-13]